MTQFFDVGKIANTHGLKGELKIVPTTDFVDERFTPGQKLVIDHQGQKIPVTVNSTRKQKNFLLVTFKEFTDINEVEKFKGDMLFVAEDEIHQLTDDSYYYHEILGLEVVDEKTGEVYGTISDIQSPGANDIWEIKPKSGKSFWIPFIKQVVKKIDLEQHQVYVELMEGLRDEN